MSHITNFLFALRNRHFTIVDGLILIVAPLLAIILRIDSVYAPLRYGMPLVVYTLLSLAIYWPILRRWGMYSRYWRYASLDELLVIGEAAFVAGLSIVVLFFALRAPGIMALFAGLPVLEELTHLAELPRSTPLIAAALTGILLGLSRFSVRAAEHWQRQRRETAGQRVLIVGAGDAGIMIARELERNHQLGLEAIGFLDDDRAKQGVRIQGLPVLGGRPDLAEVSQQYQVKQVIIAMPTAPGAVIREIKEICQENKLQTKIVPGIYELLDGTVTVQQLREVDIEDLLRREPVQTDITAVQAFITGRRVLVTGAGGSIGSELCRQIWRCQPAELILLGHGENSIFAIQSELQRLGGGQSPTIIQAVVADTRFAGQIRHIFAQYRPELVFHAAAHKHVPLMEENPVEAVSNNVIGTRNLLEAAVAYDVARFVMISTDKAVNPTSVMGASKRTAELLVHQLARTHKRPFVAVRFGNVLGSRGSVVLTFKQQIAAGGPVTITHPEMVRYFMTIPEAVQLVLQAAVLAQGGEIFMLDMGQPVKILDLAHDLIRLSGLEVGRDIEVVYTGCRPGEKLYEELFVTGETYQPTLHEKIFIATKATRSLVPHLSASLAALETAVDGHNPAAVVDALCDLIPEYQPDAAHSSLANGAGGSMGRAADPQLRPLPAGESTASGADRPASPALRTV
jgi:FlaA1/EpsC-like NDP-sugar epimerase